MFNGCGDGASMLHKLTCCLHKSTSQAFSTRGLRNAWYAVGQASSASSIANHLHPPPPAPTALAAPPP
jgi:hypothetical protein